jgi:integrase
MSRHPSGQARVRVGREEHWLGRFGSPEAQRRYDAIIKGILDQRNAWAEPVPVAGPIASPPATVDELRVVDVRGPLAAAPAAPAVGGVELPTEAVGITVAEVCSRFLVYADREYRDATGTPTSTIGNYRMAVRALRPYDDVSANAFNAPLFKDMIQRLVNEERPARSKGKPPQRWPRQTINRIAKSVRFIFQWAVTEELVSPNVPAKLEAVKLLARHRTTAPERKKVKPVLDENIERTLPHLPKMVADIVRVQRYTGCRPGEVCAMICGEVDRSGATWIWRPEQHKNAWRGHEREIAIGPRARRILEPYLERRPDEYVFIASESEAARNQERRAGRTSPMTPSQKARRERAFARRRRRTPYTEAAYRRAIARACEKHGIPRWHPHQIRHTTGTEVRGKAGLDAAQVRLGHKSAKTAEIYAALTLKQQIEIAEMYG